jgi:hypothetical protein
MCKVVFFFQDGCPTDQYSTTTRRYLSMDSLDERIPRVATAKEPGTTSWYPVDKRQARIRKIDNYEKHGSTHSGTDERPEIYKSSPVGDFTIQ